MYGIRGSIPYLVVPFVFFITLFRFSIGNILHLRHLEQHIFNCEKQRWVSFIWLYDFSVITIESLIFLLLGMYSWGNDLRFVKLLMFLCFLDGLWIVSMIPHCLNGKQTTMRPKPLPWAWCLLNILGGIYLGATIWYGIPFPFPSDAGYIFFVLGFLGSAIIDIILFDHYKLLRF